MRAELARPLGITRATPLPAGWYLTTADAAAELGVTVRAVNLAVGRGRIVATDVGGRLLITAEEVARYRDTRAHVGPGPGGRRWRGERSEPVRRRHPRADEWKGDAVYYRQYNGRKLRISRKMATAIGYISEHGAPWHEGEAADALWDSLDGEMTRTKVVHLINHLVKLGLVRRVVSRDKHDIAQRHLVVGVNGNDALVYCRARGLV